VNPIRPNLTPSVQSNAATKPADAARSAAQKAFFDIAMGKAAATAPAAAVQPATSTASAAPLQRVAQVPAEAPARPLRPGSLLDIRV
jgi:hypothetical protein